VRTVSLESGQGTETDSDLSFLRLQDRPPWESGPTPISVVDLFSGCGGLTIGVLEGARRAGRGGSLVLAIDNDVAPLEVLEASLGKAVAGTAVSDLGDALGPPGSRIRRGERKLLGVADGATILVAGPPCQGHSALNNHTRHDDPRNDLYLTVARAAEILRPAVVIVENVRGVGRDRRRAAGRCRQVLEERLGYRVIERRIDLAWIGVPQRRIRHLMIATRSRELAWQPVVPIGGCGYRRDVAWAIEDLLDREGETPFDAPSKAIPANQRRIDWLFDKDEDNLPNHLRPVCHRSDHSYLSMYGRLRWHEPAQTITSGFGSMGQGRFVHPLRRRTLTPHEAARLQFLPDFMTIGALATQKARARVIGNAAPPKLTMDITEALISQDLLITA